MDEIRRTFANAWLGRKATPDHDILLIWADWEEELGDHQLSLFLRYLHREQKWPRFDITFEDKPGWYFYTTTRPDRYYDLWRGDFRHMDDFDENFQWANMDLLTYIIKMSGHFHERKIRP